MRKADGALSGFKDNVKAFSGQFGALAGLLGAVAAQALVFKEALDLGGEMVDLAANTGENIADLVVLRQAFTNAGLGADGVGGALAKLQKALSGINEEGQPTSEAFQRLGLSIHTLRDMNATEQLETIGKAIAALPNQADRTRTAMELFGKSGAKMLALFTDSGALQMARDQVGELGHTLSDNAGEFDSIGDNIGALRTKFEQFATGATSALTAALSGPAKDFAKLDFTSIGVALGTVVSWFVELLRIVWQFMPVWIALGANMLATAVKARLAKSVFASELPAAIAAAKASVRQFGAALTALNWTAFKTAGVSAMTAIKSAAKGLYAALGPIGAALLTFQYIVKPLMEKANGGSVDQWNNYAGTTKNIGHDSQTSYNRSQKTYKGVSSEGERYSAIGAMEAEISSIEERIATVGLDYADLSSEQQAGILSQLNQWKLSLEITSRQLKEIPPEILRARAAENARAAALEESRKKAEELAKAVAKGVEDLDKAKVDDYFNALTTAQQKAYLLQNGKAGSTAALDKEIEKLKSASKSGKLDTGEEERLVRLLDLRKQLVGVERRITEERTKQLEKNREDAEKAKEQAARDKEKADDARQKRQDYERDYALDLRKMIAEASGDTDAADKADRDRRYADALDAAKSAGLDQPDAERHAAFKVRIEDEKTKREKAAQRTGETRIEGDALARVAGGGYVGISRTNPQLEEARRQTRELNLQTNLLKTLNKLLGAKPAQIIKVQPVLG